MRHRLFHAIVLVGAALPAAGCAAETTEPTPAQDSGAAQDTSMWSGDALLTSDSSAPDTAVTDTTVTDTTVTDTARPDTTATDTAIVDAGPDVCDGGCGSSCFPCIK